MTGNSSRDYALSMSRYTYGDSLLAAERLIPYDLEVRDPDGNLQERIPADSIDEAKKRGKDYI